MGLPSIGVPSLILIIVLALIIFGPKKLPEIGKATGQTLREFKNSTKDVIEDEDTSDKTNHETNNTNSDSKSNQT